MLENCRLAADQDGPGQATRTARRPLELGAHPEGLARSPGRPLAMMVSRGVMERARALIAVEAAGQDARDLGGRMRDLQARRAKWQARLDAAEAGRFEPGTIHIHSERGTISTTLPSPIPK